MAIVHTATVLATRPIGIDGRHLTLALTPGAELGKGVLDFVGGQYLIVDSGLTLPSGRAAKRAYSIISSDADQTTGELIVKRVVRDTGGVVSAFLHGAEVGTSFHFSGPWGKYVAAEPVGRTLVLATDTGITAALGLLAGRAFADRAATTDVVWLADDFVSEAFVAERLRDRCARLRVLRPGGDRVTAAVQAALASDDIGAVYLSGDGDVLYPVRAALVDCGVPEAAFRIESFFNVPKVDRKVP